MSCELSATRRPTRAAPQLRCSKRPVLEAATHFYCPAEGSRKVYVLLPDGVRRGEGAMTAPPKEACLPTRPVPALSALEGEESWAGAGRGSSARLRWKGGEGCSRVVPDAREPGWSQQPGAASAFRMQIDSPLRRPPPPSPARGARLRRSAAAHASCAPRRLSGRLYLSRAPAETRHSPGARG